MAAGRFWPPREVQDQTGRDIAAESCLQTPELGQSPRDVNDPSSSEQQLRRLDPSEAFEAPPGAVVR
jgi:hypothetical protein